MYQQFTYQATLAASEKINWRVEDIIGGERALDFGKHFLPESLARVEPLAFLDANEKLVLNQIRGHGYLYTFGLVEEFILPFVLDHARPHLTGDDYRVRALLRFAGEEAKHIHLFKRFREEFQRGFGFDCAVIGPPHEIARAVLAHHPLGIALAITHIEWMTQRHYLDSVMDDGRLDPQFKSLLKHHWMEEAQHAKIDTLMVQALTDACTRDEIDAAVDEYLQIGLLLDGGLMQQVQMDLQCLQTALDRTLTDEQCREFTAVQQQAMRWTFLGSGMTHKNFLSTLEDLNPAARRKIEEIAPAFC